MHVIAFSTPSEHVLDNSPKLRIHVVLERTVCPLQYDVHLFDKLVEAKVGRHVLAQRCDVLLKADDFRARLLQLRLHLAQSLDGQLGACLQLAHGGALADLQLSVLLNDVIEDLLHSVAGFLLDFVDQLGFEALHTNKTHTFRNFST